MQPYEIYIVRTEGDCEGRSTRTVGYATGHPDDIREYYKDEAYYDLKLQKVPVMNVTQDLIQEKQELKTEQRRLEDRLKEIKGRLHGY